MEIRPTNGNFHIVLHPVIWLANYFRLSPLEASRASNDLGLRGLYLVGLPLLLPHKLLLLLPFLKLLLLLILLPNHRHHHHFIHD